MSKTVTVLHSGKFTKGEYAGRKVIMPLIGTVQFNDDGTLDVEDSLVDEFISATKDSFDFSDGIKAEPKKKKKDEPEEDDDEDDSGLEELKQQLADATTQELLELVKETDIKPEKAASWTDARLRKELLKVLK